MTEKFTPQQGAVLDALLMAHPQKVAGERGTIVRYHGYIASVNLRAARHLFQRGFLAAHGWDPRLSFTLTEKGHAAAVDRAQAAEDI